MFPKIIDKIADMTYNIIGIKKYQLPCGEKISWGEYL